jgi:hypothetical protein
MREPECRQIWLARRLRPVTIKIKTLAAQNTEFWSAFSLIQFKSVCTQIGIGSRAVAITFPSLGVMLLTGVAPGPAFRPARCDWTAGSHRPPLAEAIAPH